MTIRTSSFFLFLLLFLSCNSITERMENYEVHGIDISHYQSHIQWDAIVEQGISFAFAKATEGNSLQDKHYCTNWKEMERVGLKKGAYHFFRPKVSARLQFENFMEQVDLKAGDLPPVLDIELTDGASKMEIIEGVKEWLLLAEIRYQVRPIIYSNYNFYIEYLSKEFSEYPVWIARYSRRIPYLPKGKNWQFWQYGNKGQLDGIEGDVDLNVFNGTSKELEQWGIPSQQILSYKFNQ